MNTIILNSTNHIANTTNRFEYMLPSSVKFEKDDAIALQSIAIYNSVFNVEAVRSNNKMSIIWNADTTVQYDLTIPDGFYDITQLNYFLQQQCILNDLYMIDSTGKYIYFFEILINSSAYGSQLSSYVLPTSAEASTNGWIIPVGASWTFPVSNKAVQFIIPSVAFGDLLGFVPATYPSTVLTSNVQYLSTKTPQISPVNSFLLSCNLINSPFSNPTSMFYSIPVITNFGGLLNITNSSPIFNQIASGLYNKITIELFDQSFQPLRLNDFDVVIVLNIKKNI